MFQSSPCPSLFSTQDSNWDWYGLGSEWPSIDDVTKFPKFFDPSLPHVTFFQIEQRGKNWSPITRANNYRFHYYQLLEIYDCSREELRIGPFSYEPMRAVDFWLQQNDDFLLNLSSAPDVAPPSFVQLVRSTLKRIKDDPYPAVTIFHTNSPRYYR